jgi:hypothetical protein
MSKPSDDKNREAEDCYRRTLLEFIADEERVAAARLRGWQSRMEQLFRRHRPEGDVEQ